jgi:serralysin
MNAIQSILEGTTVSGTPLLSFGSFKQVANLDISLAATPAGASDLTIGQANVFEGEDLPTALVADFPGLDQRLSGGDVWFGDDYRNTGRPRSERIPGAARVCSLRSAIARKLHSEREAASPICPFYVPKASLRSDNNGISARRLA